MFPAQDARKSGPNLRLGLVGIAALEHMGRQRGAVVEDRPGPSRRRWFLGFQVVQLLAQLSAAFEIRRSERGHYFIPRHLDKNLGMGGQLPLLGSSFSGSSIQRGAIRWFQSVPF